MLKLQEDQEEIEEINRRRFSVVVHVVKEMTDDVGAGVGAGANKDQVVQLLRDVRRCFC